jgi:Recombination endonuclease VII
MREIQVPGKEWTFKSKSWKEDAGILPAVYGESNDFAFWCTSSRHAARGGYWKSRVHNASKGRRIASGNSPTGLLGRMQRLIANSKYKARTEGFAPPDTTPEKMLSEWINQRNKCAACGGELTNKKRSTAYDHNHETGETRGFIHQRCNFMEGTTKPLSDEQFLCLFGWLGNQRNLKIVLDKQQPIVL